MVATRPVDFRKGHEGLSARHIAPSRAGIDLFERLRIVLERLTGSFDQPCRLHRALCR